MVLITIHDHFDQIKGFFEMRFERLHRYHSWMESQNSPNTAPSLDALTRIQRERLSHIDFTLFFLGELRRADVISKFETAPAGATETLRCIEVWPQTT